MKASVRQWVIAASAAFTLVAISFSVGFLAWHISALADQLRETAKETAGTAQQLKQTAGRVDAMIADLQARQVTRDLSTTVKTANGVLNFVRDMERDNRADVKAINERTLESVNNFAGLISSVDASQKSAAGAIQQTSAALIPVLAQTREDLASLEPAIKQTAPLMVRATDVAVNVSNTTADIEHEIHKFVYPPPRKWYQKWLLDPLKTAAHLITIPITSF